MKPSGGIKPRFGCIQRMSASALRTAPVFGVHLGLIVEFELIEGDGAVQVALELHPLLRAGVHSAFEALHVAAAALLGAVHRRIGVRDQRLDRSCHPSG